MESLDDEQQRQGALESPDWRKGRGETRSLREFDDRDAGLVITARALIGHECDTLPVHLGCVG